jgi:hypothetical protein
MQHADILASDFWLLPEYATIVAKVFAAAFPFTGAFSLYPVTSHL